jgi:hypothetical protein
MSTMFTFLREEPHMITEALKLLNLTAFIELTSSSTTTRFGATLFEKFASKEVTAGFCVSCNLSCVTCRINPLTFVVFYHETAWSGSSTRLTKPPARVVAFAKKMAGDHGGPEPQFTGIKKIFNAETIKGRRNVSEQNR